MNHPDTRLAYHPDTIHGLIGYLKSRREALIARNKIEVTTPGDRSTVQIAEAQSAIDTINGALEAIRDLELLNKRKRLNRELGLDD